MCGVYPSLVPISLYHIYWPNASTGVCDQLRWWIAFITSSIGCLIMAGALDDALQVGGRGDILIGWELIVDSLYAAQHKALMLLSD